MHGVFRRQCGRPHQHHSGHGTGQSDRWIPRHHATDLLAQEILPAGQTYSERTEKPGGDHSLRLAANSGVLARLPAAGRAGKRKVPVLAAIDVDHGAQTQAASVGGYPGHLRLSLPQDMRAAYSLSKGSKNLMPINGIRFEQKKHRRIRSVHE